MSLPNPPKIILEKIDDVGKLINQVQQYVANPTPGLSSSEPVNEDSSSTESDPTQRTFLGPGAKGPKVKETPFKPKHHSSREGKDSKKKTNPLSELEKAYEKIRSLTERLQLSENSNLHQPVEPIDRNPIPEFFSESSEEEYEVPARRNRANSNKSHRVSKWGLTFNGDKKHHQLTTFLTKVQHLRKAEGISSAELRRSSYYLFSGEALNWFMAFGEEYPTWDDLVRGLKSEFLPPDSGYWFLKEIESKLQKPNESFGAYLAKMEILFRDLPNPIEDNEKLNILRRNILPHFTEKISLLNINSVARLSYYCRQIEATMSQIASRKPSSYKVDEVKPVEESPEKRLYDPGTVRQRYDNRTVHLRCYNCLHEGHHFNDCTLPRKVFCYKCGSQGVTLPNCKRCSRSGNQ